MGRRAMDQAEEDNWPGLLRDWQAQLRSANVSECHRVAGNRHVERFHPRLRLPAGPQIHHRNGHQGRGMRLHHIASHCR